MLPIRSWVSFAAITLLLVTELSAEEAASNAPPDGFVALFNGNDLSDWKGLVGNPVTRNAMSPEELAAAQEKADQSMRDHWKVVDGVIEYDGKGKSLVTAREYANFELYVDWKIDRNADSESSMRSSLGSIR